MDPQEYFARAVEGTGIDGTEASRGDGADPDGLAEELATVARLRAAAPYGVADDGHHPGSPPDHGPTATERGRIRERILAELSAPAASQPPSRPPRPRRSPPPLATEGPLHRRFSRAMAVTVCLLIAVSASSLLFAGDALPGDPLYGIKRSMEHAHLALSFGEKSTGFTHLDLAANRVHEVESLTARDEPTPATDYVTALRAFDADAAAGSRALTDVGTNAAESTLTALRSWSADKYRRLDAVRSDLPARAESTSASSLTLLRHILGRVDALRARFGCRSITSGARDDLGPLAATGTCRYSPRTVDPYASVTPIPPAAPKGGAGQQPSPPARRVDASPHRPRVLAEARTQRPEPAPVTTEPPTPAPQPPTHVTPPTTAGDDGPSLRVPLPVDLGAVAVPGVLSLRLG